MSVDRREFLKHAVWAAAALAGGGAWPVWPGAAGALGTAAWGQAEAQDESDPFGKGSGSNAVRVLVAEADGQALAAERGRTLHARDLLNDTLPQPIARATGRVRVELSVDEPIQLVCRLKVPGFGEINCYADNAGQGYRTPETIDFVVDAAATRLKRVREALASAKQAGVPVERALEERLEQAARPLPADGGAARTAAAYERLAHGLHAGEMLALARARHRIARLPAPRKDFGFGCSVAGFDVRGPEFVKHFRSLFNFATASWYHWRNDESSAATDPVDYGRMDRSIDWLLASGITTKTFGYLYMARGATPLWLRPEEPATQRAGGSATGGIREAPAQKSRMGAFNERWPYAKLRDLYARVIEATVRRYDGRVPYVEVMNEAHDKANLWRLSQGQILDMAKMAMVAARRGSKTIKRQMNHCCLWSEYAKSRNADGSRRWSPYQFIKACFDNGIDYEVIGLQLYYPQFDLFEIDRMLDRFNTFGRPLHITEIATASQDGLDPDSMRPRTAAPGWHGPWTESMQADWVEGIYTLIYSKPEFEAIGWWDFSDAPGHFWPHGGLLRKDMTPKEAVGRLVVLKKRWGV